MNEVRNMQVEKNRTFNGEKSDPSDLGAEKTAQRKKYTNQSKMNYLFWIK